MSGSQVNLARKNISAVNQAIKKGRHMEKW